MITGAQAMIQSLKNEGVDIIFGYPGAAIAPFYDLLADSGIRHILTRSEQGAGHAASGYARVSGRPGVCVVTSGPGATNLFTAIATAYSDSIPIIAITGQVSSDLLGKDVFQEVDTTGAAEPFTKYSYLVKSPEDIGRVFKEAFHIASTGRMGPVLIDVPIDTQTKLAEYNWPQSIDIRGYKPNYDGHPLQIKKVSEAISAAKRPLICCGGGVILSGAQQEVKKLSESAKIPVVSTMMGIGAIPPNSQYYYGMLGQSGFNTANQAVLESDLLILVSARVGDRAITRPDNLGDDKTIVHIDIDTAEIGKNLGATIPLVGDASRVLSQLLKKRISGEWSSWIERLNELKSAEQKEIKTKSETKYTDPNLFVKMLCKALPDDSIYVADVGQNQIWSARNFSSNGRFMTTGGMGTMGYSLPSAIGAKLADPSQQTVAVCGDGAFQMSMNELATVIKNQVPVKVAVMRNGTLGMVRELQHLNFSGREAAIDISGPPDLELIAKAYGIKYSAISSNNEIKDALKLFLGADEPYILECFVDPDKMSAN